MVAKQRSDLLPAEYLLDMHVLRGHPEMLVFVDETGADRRNCLRRFGYSLRGKPVVSKKLFVHGQRVSAIPAMSPEGILNCYTVTGSVNVNFSGFAQQALLPQLQPFNGVNDHSVVILDNASIHHIDGMVILLNQLEHWWSSSPL